jgi:hypothetical protein
VAGETGGGVQRGKKRREQTAVRRSPTTAPLVDVLDVVDTPSHRVLLFPHQLGKDLEPLTKPPEPKPLLTAPKPQKYIPFDYWQTLDETEQQRVISSAPLNSREGW